MTVKCLWYTHNLQLCSRAAENSLAGQGLETNSLHTRHSRLFSVAVSRRVHGVLRNKDNHPLPPKKEVYTLLVDNSSTERVEQFKYLGTTLTNQNSIQKEIKSRVKLGNACYHSVQNLLSYSLLSKNLKIKVYRTITLPVVLYGCGI